MDKTNKERKKPVQRNAARLCKDLKSDLLAAQMKASREGASEFEEAFDNARVILGDALKMHEAGETRVELPDA